MESAGPHAARDSVWRRTWVQASMVFGAALAVYLATRLPDNPFNQYVRLADAFLHGRLWIPDPPDYLELARIGGRAYVIEPPAPTLLLLPVVALWGVDINQTYVSVVVGAGAVALFWLAFRAFWDDPRLAAWAAALLGVGTNLWWVATDGGLWTFAHAAAVLYAGGALAVAARKGPPWAVGLLLGLAGLSRLPMFLTAPLFAFLVVGERLSFDRRALVRLAGFGAPLAAAVGIYGLYNLGRYGSLTDGGYSHPQYLDHPWFNRGLFDLAYIPRHLAAILFTPPEQIERFPYFKPSALGVGLAITTPALLYVFRARFTPRNVAAAIAVLLAAVPAVTYGATGWSQFGYRFALDWTAPLFLLVGSGVIRTMEADAHEGRRPRIGWRRWAVLGWCVAVNLWGVLAFNRLGWVDL